MAGDYEDSWDLETMTDEELRALVRDQLNEYPDLDPSGLDVLVRDGRVTMEGRIGTEAEFQAIEHVLTDVIGVADVDNNLVVDELVRLEHAEAADEANTEVYTEGGGAHGGADRTEDSAEHLLEDTAAEQFGTGGMDEAVERGHSYNPPVRPPQEGTWSKENH